ncbi:hypothetical protein HYS93_04985 [Candidatus Daviesbacteria bacterium]|nr:hypothetical protein [Candidatus Daviesbacteria bacterium]
MQKGFAWLILLIIGLLVIGGIGFWAYQNNFQNFRQIKSFEDCAKAGYPVMKSYPAQCNTPDNRHFVQQLSDEEKEKLKPPKDNQVCIQVITPAKNPKTGECKDFPTPCDVPEGWDKVESCQSR